MINIDIEQCELLFLFDNLIKFYKYQSKHKKFSENKMNKIQRYKGRYIKESVLKKKQQWNDYLKRQRETGQTITSIEKKYPAEGIRVVDLKLLGKNLKCHKCIRTLSLENVVAERKTGLYSILSVKCDFCHETTEVSTGEQCKIRVKNQLRTSVQPKLENDNSVNANDVPEDQVSPRNEFADEYSDFVKVNLPKSIAMRRVILEEIS